MWGSKIYEFLKRPFNLTLFAAKIFMNGTCTPNFYIPCKFPMVMHSVLIFHKRCMSKNIFYGLSYNKTVV